MDINPISNSVITILTTVASIFAANFSLDIYREIKERKKKAKLFLYKLEEGRKYLLTLKSAIENPSQDSFTGLSEKVSVTQLLENKPPDDLVIFDEGVLEQVAEYFTATKRFVCEFQNFLEDDRIEILRPLMVVKADAVTIENDLCILVFLEKYFFFEKYFSKSQKSKINSLKSKLKWKYKTLKKEEEKKLGELNVDSKYDPLLDELTFFDSQCEYYSEYSIKNIERVFKSLNWDIKR